MSTTRKNFPTFGVNFFYSSSCHGFLIDIRVPGHPALQFVSEPCPNGRPSSDFCPVASALSCHLGAEFSWLTIRHELKQRCMTHVVEHRLFLIALIICGDVCCDDCSMWYHRLCPDMSQSAYRRLGNSATSWHCICCDNASVNSFTFHGYNIPTHNSFSVLQDMEEDSVFLPNRSAALSTTSDFCPVPLAPLGQQDSPVDPLITPKVPQWVVTKTSHSQILMASFVS